MRKFFFLFSTLACLTAVVAKAQKSGSGPIQILEATQQTTKPNRGDLTPFTTYRFRIIWKSNTPPVSFFWKPATTVWMETSTAKPQKRPGLAPGDYMIVEKNILPKDIRNGDTILLTTHRHGHDEEPMPQEVKSQPANNIYFQLGSKPVWQRVPANIKKLPDMQY